MESLMSMNIKLKDDDNETSVPRALTKLTIKLLAIESQFILNFQFDSLRKILIVK